MVADLLVRVVRARVPSLVMKRGHWRGDCPWCADGMVDPSPSFYVYADRYHCFHCGEHGDAIAFLMWFENIRFAQAAEWLAVEAGIRPAETLQ